MARLLRACFVEGHQNYVRKTTNGFVFAAAVQPDSSSRYNPAMDSTVYTTDTSSEALTVQLECLRRMSPNERLERSCAMSNQVKRMAFAAIRRRHPDFSEEEVRLKFIELTYGQSLAEDVRKRRRL